METVINDVKYEEMTAVLTGAIQELKQENDQLKSAICRINPEEDFCATLV